MARHCTNDGDQRDGRSGSWEKRPWQPKKRLSRDAIEHLRALHGSAPAQFGHKVLSDMFGISQEAVRRILRSRFDPSDAGEAEAEAAWDFSLHSLQPGRLTELLLQHGMLPRGGGAGDR